MSELEVPPDLARPAVRRQELTVYTLIAAALAACLAEAALAIPASLTGLLQQDIGTSSSQLTWITDGFLVPVSLFELTFGVLGDLFGRKRLLVGGALLLAVGEAVVFLSPGSGSSTGTRVAVILTGQVLAGIGAGALFPTSLAMIASATHTQKARARGVAVWVSGFTFGALVGPVIGGVAAQAHYGADVNAGWRWAFLVVLVLAVASAGLSFLAQDSSAPEGRSLDWTGQVTIAVAVFHPAVRGHSGAHQRLGQRTGDRLLHRRRRLRRGVRRRRTPVSGAAAAARVFPAPQLRGGLGRHRGRHVRLPRHGLRDRHPAGHGAGLLAAEDLPCLGPGRRDDADPAARRPPPAGALRHQVGARRRARHHGAGDLWLAATDNTDVSYARIWAPLLLIGIGIALALASFTAGAVNGMPTHLAGMASGANNMLRDLGATLGPAVIGAVALSQAASRISGAVAASPSLRGAVAAFTASAAHAPAAQRPALEGAVHAVQSGPLGASAVPATVTLPNGHAMPFNPLHDVAYQALTHGYATGYVICAAAAFAAAAVAFAAMSGTGAGHGVHRDHPAHGFISSGKSIS